MHDASSGHFHNSLTELKAIRISRVPFQQNENKTSKSKSKSRQGSSGWSEPYDEAAWNSSLTLRFLRGTDASTRELTRIGGVRGTPYIAIPPPTHMSPDKHDVFEYTYYNPDA